MVGFGAALTDSSSKLLSELKSKNAGNYWALLKKLCDPTDGGSGAGFSYLRIPLGASYFSDSVYSFDDVSGDTSLSHFDIDKAPSYLFSTLNDIVGINSYLKIQITPWSPPGWMKDSGTMNGGKFYTSYSDVYTNYLLKCLQGYKSKGFDIWAISIQNEPLNSNPSYPTNLIDPFWESQVATKLRSLMNSNGFSGADVIGFDHNWSDADGYPVELMEDAESAFDGVSFHCYAGSVSDQDTFHNAYPSKNWSDVKWYSNNIFIGAVNHYARNAAVWNLALDGNRNPKLPGTTSCGGSDPCRGVVTIFSDGTYGLNQEFYAIAQASKAILPKDKGGPLGRHIKVDVGGNQNLVVSFFVTERTSSSDWNRYSLVVLNQRNDGKWDPVGIKATIEFRGKQATYTFPVGVTTVWWYAAPQ
ncbi:glycoside hydrolase family 30 protein [Postia placenta MAD-698-R-SB12]|uniref:Glycoside hydrolase family 30 protein n=1 Tax=Postia placenta MAD-698-R-SB12 TaxID=670580 RepID=A0A1X6N077_9APHY|nr:glycoside hydrolase family 30 protein [Postia placenta MAD-698-R-SB12]OSX61843.1 glycoside hydrolase family 30 protein [Postia placenta MAD-698-R-SB12]